MKKVINVAELAAPNWNFVEDHYQLNNVVWRYYSANPQNTIERFISRPKISRYRACMQATRAISSEQDIIISHLPRMTHWQSVFMKTFGHSNRHLAFSFNFTDLPGNTLRSAMKKSLASIESIVTYSQFEKTLYADFFDLPIKKIQMLHWAMGTPTTDDEYSPPLKGNFYCAMGGEGRDYKTLLQAFEKLKKLNLVIVTRPYAMEGIKVPSNVKVLYNLPKEKFWEVVKKSKAVIVPLRNADTNCGHITLVGAMKLRKAVISSFSHGTTDYIVDNETGLVVSPQSLDELVKAIERIEDDPHTRERLAEGGYQFVSEHCDPAVWAKFIQDFVEQDRNG